jgi:uncharacterized membrane protein (UPF0127 family)
MLVALLSRENILVQRHKENKFRTIVFGILVIIVLVVLLLLLLPHNRTSEIVNLGDGTFGARIAKTESDREQGLSGVASLTSNKALLMVFPYSAQWQIWMKDMKIPLDIVWLNQDKKVIYIVKDALPKDSTNVIFTPTADAEYVIELPAGSVKNHSISLGEEASFYNVTSGVN